jgi:endonuclease/exonuclease/phosphatase family metal-dependent hydrolase
MVIEFFAATLGFLRGIFSGREFWQELVMIPARVMVVVLLRELVTIGTCYDAARGLPIIHVNLLGYDEQAHRRGPGSRFAHWTLQGIDKAIRRIWRAAHLGAGREYDLWVFSDHGQETTRPYQNDHGQSIQQLVAQWVDDQLPNEPSGVDPKKSRQRLPSRANWLGIGWLVSMAFGEQDHDIQTRSPNVQTVTSGPLAFVYLLNESAKSRANELARDLVCKYDVPMAAQPLPGKRAKVSTLEGTFYLPDDTLLVFGADHPFLEDVTADLIQLINHQDAGEITLIGWTRPSPSTSFVLQHGAHAGPGPEETRAFALLPNDVPLPAPHRQYLRPDDLRRAALHFLGRSSDGETLRDTAPAAHRGIRLMTYNVHACVGMDGQLSPERIARVIAQSDCDIICLQELDVQRQRSGKTDQAQAIARHLKMNHHFHPAWHIQEERFGNAILTRFPMKVIEAGGLHHHKQDRSRRSALWAEIETPQGLALQVINAHLSIYPQEQLIQAQQLINEWVKPASLRGPVVLCGDFNARPKSRTHRVCVGNMTDVEEADNRRVGSTYFSPYPLMRVDHIFVTEDLKPIQASIISSRLARIASDHLPLVADLKLRSAVDVVDVNPEQANSI